jgi:hypothetical protein
MMAKAKMSREEEVASILKRIYEVYGADLAKFFERLAKQRPAEKTPDLTHVRSAIRKHDGGPSTR